MDQEGSHPTSTSLKNTNPNATTTSPSDQPRGQESEDVGRWNSGGLVSNWEGTKPLDVDFKDGPGLDLSLRDPSARDRAVPDSNLANSTQNTQSKQSTQPPTPARAAPAPPIEEANRRERKDEGNGEKDSGYEAPRGVEPTRYGQAYSERNPPPNIQSLREHQQAREEESRNYFKQQEDKTAGARKQTEKGKAGSGAPSADDGPKAHATDDVPIGGEKSNVLFHPTPQVNFDHVYDALKQDLRQVAYLIFGSVIVLDWLFIGGGWIGFLKSLLPAAGVAAAVYLILVRAGQNASAGTMEETAPKTEKLAYVPESVEWMNTLVETLWDTLQQNFFDGIRDQINDTIKPYIPAGVPATVKITDLGHGCQSVRVLSMRSLPDSEFGDLVPTHGLEKGSVQEQKEREQKVKNEQGGVFYNLEIAIAYHEAPFKSRKDQMHVDVLAMVGPVPLPVFVQVKEFVATIRVRLQMHPDLPFLKQVTFALTENPKVNTSSQYIFFTLTLERSTHVYRWVLLGLWISSTYQSLIVFWNLKSIMRRLSLFSRNR